MNNEPEQTPAIISNSIVQLNKASIRDFAMSVVEKYTDGYNSPTEGLILAKKLQEMAELIKNNLSDAAASELKLGKGEKYSKFDTEINEQMVGVRYDFESTGSSKWKQLSTELKEHEDFLKTIKGTMTIVDEDSGEVETLREPAKSGKLSLVLKMK